MSDALTDRLTKLSAVQRMMDEWVPQTEPFPGETLLADGWVYRDLPRLVPELFDKFIALVGADNIRWLTFANYGDSKRGQLLISPAGQQNLRAYLEQEGAAS